ncbi:MAG: TIGR04086 family membrane protein [Oscillospiraceae bacterium]|jgi:putative membrane protein (TIGR04086 family)|nr:TIGR04086 family membrane protein [Oscillospiraceae bacterium]
MAIHSYERKFPKALLFGVMRGLVLCLVLILILAPFVYYLENIIKIEYLSLIICALSAMFCGFSCTKILKKSNFFPSVVSSFFLFLVFLFFGLLTSKEYSCLIFLRLPIMIILGVIGGKIQNLFKTKIYFIKGTRSKIK